MGRAGVSDWNTKHAVHLVAYYRYMRFLPGSRIVYRTSPDVVARVAKTLVPPAAALTRKSRRHERDDSLLTGRYRLDVRSCPLMVLTAG